VFDLNGTLLIDYSAAVNSGSDRGFTGHEHLDEFGLVHMNGRLYDPRLGLFLQADPLLQDALNLQNYQRYAYCFNGPLGCTDPTGYFFLTKWWKKVWHSSVGRAVLSIAVAVTMQWYVLPTYFDLLATSWQAAAISGFSAGVVQSGDLKGALQGAFFAAAFSGIGAGFGEFDFANLDVGKFAGAVAAHAVVGCAQSVAGGGKCGPGALSAAFSKLVTPVTGPLATGADGGKDLSGVVVGTVVSAVVGGTAAELGGGKFANGAVTGAFGYLFNAAASELRKQYSQGKGHHYFPFEEWPGSLSEAAKLEFGRSTTGALEPGTHLRDRVHIGYGQAVRELFDAKGIDPASMTADQARAFVAEIKASSDPRIRGYLVNLHAARVTPARSVLKGIGALSIGIGLVPLLIDPTYTWRNYFEDSLCGLAGGCGGAY
jgi:RHS repeat-associated protein